MRQFSNGGAGAVFLIIAFLITVGCGWVFNIIKLVAFLSDGFAGHELMMIFRIIGVFVAPIGAVLGFF